MAYELPGAGELRHRLAFDKRSEGGDGYGNTVTTWEEQFKTWAAMRSRGGSEAVIAGRLEGRNMVSVYVRSSRAARAIDTDWRARDLRTGTVYAVVHADTFTNEAFVYLDLQSGVAT